MSRERWWLYREVDGDEGRCGGAEYAVEGGGVEEWGGVDSGDRGT